MSTCPQGYRYRPASDVVGSCVKNKKNSAVFDERCPSGMHWRNTYTRKAKCVKVPVRKFQAPPPNTVQLPPCDPTFSEQLFEDHLVIIKSYMTEFFTVPIGKETFTKQRLFKKVRTTFLNSIKAKLKEYKCTFLLTSKQKKRLYTLFLREVLSHNYKLVSMEQWSYIESIAELDMLLLVARKAAAANSALQLTPLYYTKSDELRQGLLYLSENGLLPRQNIVVAEAYYTYISHFVTQDNVHGVTQPPPVPSSEQQQNRKALLNKAVALGLLTGLAVSASEQSQLPLFQPVLSTPSIPASAMVVPSSLTATLSPSRSPFQPGSTRLSQDEMNELYDLYLLFHDTYEQLAVPPDLTQRGEELSERYIELFGKLSSFFDSSKTEQDIFKYISNYGRVNRNFVDLGSLELQYGGPFWVSVL